MAYTTIKKPSDYFNTKLYTGNGSTQTISSVGFEPSMTWLKNRDTGNDHELFDAIRGATKTIYPNRNDAEYTNASGSLTSFNSDGFSVGSGDGANKSGSGIASWNWKANGAGSANTDGATASTVSANITSGFSIVSYTGTGSQTTVGHGLGVTPKMIIVKRLQNAEDFAVYHASNGAGTYQSLNTTEAKQTNANRFNVAPTSSVFTVNTHESVNFAENYIAYCFAEKQGFSKFGSYVGNGNSDGTFVYTGFKSSFIMSKSYTNTEQWIMKDVARDTFNPVEKNLSASSASSEAGWGTAYDIDILSNGFKMRDGSGQTNGNGYGFIYMAFAEEPLVGDNPATAR